jgi:hypothetical protein
MTKKNEKAIKGARKKVKEAEQKQAVGAEFAGDYLDLQGIRFFKPTMAHIWLFQRMKTSVQCTASLSDFGVCVAYALTHKQDAVRNKLMTEVTKGQIVDRAYNFVSVKKIEIATVDEVLEKLAYKVLQIRTDDEEEDTKESEKKE